MSNIDPKRLVEKGLFPENLPSVFTTQSIWANMPPITGGYALTAKAVGEICPYDTSKRGNQRRVFGIPHPLFLRDQGLFFEKNWHELESVLAGSPGSVSKPIFEMTGNRHVRITPHSDLSRIRLQRLSRFKYCLVTDVSRFFPSIYSHSIPWAINGKAAAKTDNNWKSNTVTGNRLDFCIRQAQSRQTLGIPVGPDASKVIAEILMSAIDRYFIDISKSPKPVFVRHVDDYWIGGHTTDECERHLKNLRAALKEFSLDINESKTKIVSTKFVFGETWPSDIERAIGETFTQNPFFRAAGRDPLATFGMIIERAVDLNDDGIIKRAIRVLDRGKLWDRDWEILEHFLAQCAVQFPHSFDYVARVVSWRIRLNKPIDRSLWSEISRNTAVQNGELGRDSETCWAIWLLKELRQSLLKRETDVILTNTSPLVLAFLAHFPRHGLATDRRLLKNLQDQVSGDPFSGSSWPLSLELTHLSAGSNLWANANTVNALKLLHQAKASIINWEALPAVFNAEDSATGQIDDVPDFAIEDIGSDYSSDEDEEDAISENDDGNDDGNDDFSANYFLDNDFGFDPLL